MEKLAIIITSMPIHRTLFSWPTHVPVCVCVCACSISFFFVDLHAQRKWQTGFFPSKSYRVQVFSERKSWQSFGALWSSRLFFSFLDWPFTMATGYIIAALMELSRNAIFFSSQQRNTFSP